MYCKYCNAENPDGAVFCSSCGKRIDGKIVCPKCGAANHEDAVYCCTCGKRIDGKHACPECGAILPEGALSCSACGHSLERTPAAAPQTSVKPKKALSFWLTFAGGISILAAAAFSLIFIFCLGLTSGSEDTIIYDFFSDIYKQIELVVQNVPDVESAVDYISFPLYFNAAVGTLIAAGSLVSIPVCVTLAGIRFSRFIRGTKGNADYFAPAAAAYAVFLCSACVLLALYAGSTAGTETNVSVTMNDATLAGVILGGIFFGAGCGLRSAAKGKAPLNGKAIAKVSLAAVGSVFAVILLAFSSQGMIGIKGAGTLGDANIMSYMEIAALFFMTKIQSASSGIVYAPDEALAASLFAALFQLTVIVLAAWLFVLPWKSFWKKTTDGEHKEYYLIAVAAVLLACSVGALTATILFGNSFVEYTELNIEAVKLSYTAPIIMLVFSALLLGISIAECYLSFRKADKTA